MSINDRSMVAQELLPATKKSRKRLNLDISLEANEKLEEMSLKSGKTVAEIVRTALTIYAIIQDEKERGLGVGIIGKERDTIIREILIP